MYDDHTFHDASTIAANGTAYVVRNKKTLTVEIYGTSDTRTVTFYGKSFSDTLRAISGTKLNGLTAATSTTGTGELWQFDIRGLKEVVMDLTAITGTDANITVKGRAVAF